MGAFDNLFVKTPFSSASDLCNLSWRNELEKCVDLYWFEIADYLMQLEEYADERSARWLQLFFSAVASSLVSKIYFYLGDLDRSCDFALKASGAFAVDQDSL